MHCLISTKTQTFIHLYPEIRNQTLITTVKNTIIQTLDIQTYKTPPLRSPPKFAEKFHLEGKQQRPGDSDDVWIETSRSRDREREENPRKEKPWKGRSFFRF